MNRNKRLTKTMAAAMTGVLLAQSGAGYAYAQEKTAAEHTKEETVYIKTDAAGQKEEVIVSEWLKNPNGEVSLDDSSELTDIENVKGEESFTQDGEKLVWNADGSDIYYQGTTDKELPVSVEITYYLDGEEILPEELAGKSGHVKICYQYKNLSKDKDVYTPFTMITGMVLPGENFKNTAVKNGKVISDGEKDIVIGIGMPGLSESLKLADTEMMKDVEIPESFEMEADVTDFELTMAMTVATVLNLDNLNLDDIESMDDLEKTLDEFTDAATQLVDGSGDLAEGVQTLKDSCVELIDGMNAVDENMGTLADGISTLNTKKTDLVDGINALADGIDKLESSKGALIKGVQDLDAGSKQLKKGAKEAKSGSKTLSESTKLLLDGVNELAQGQGSQKLMQGSKQLAAGSKALKDGSATLVAGINSMMQQAEEKKMLQGSQSLADGSQQFAVLLGQYTQGVDALLNGLNSTGNNTAAGYMNSVNSYVDGVNQVFAGVKAILNQQSASTLSMETASMEEPAAETTEEQVTEEVVKTTISDQSVADIQAVLAELQSVQATLGSSTPEQLLKMADQYPAYVAKLENCINLLNDSLGGIQDESIVTTTSVQTVEAAAPEAVYAEEGTQNGTSDGGLGNLLATMAYLENAGESLKVQSAESQDPQNPTIGNAIAGLSGKSTALNNVANTIAAGAGQLNGGVKEVFAGVQNQLQPGAAQLAAGASDLYDGAVQLDTGLGTLFTGANTIAMNMKKLAAGASSLASGNAQIYSGAAALANGTGQLNAGAGTLSSGIGQLAAGGSQLRSGAGELSSGIQQLADGSGQLKEGTAQLAEGGTKLNDGVAELKDGADELNEGMEKFNEEGIEKITDFLEEDVQDMIDRLEKVKDAGTDYKLFGDSSTSGNIKFIIETGSIEAE